MRRFCAVVVCLGTIAAPALPGRAATLQTFVMTAGGQSSVGSFETPAPVSAFFGPVGPQVPVGGLAAAGVAGEIRTQTAATGPVEDTSSLDTTFNAGGNAFAGSTGARAQYGAVGARADGGFTGPTTGLTVRGAMGFGLFTDSFTISHPGIADGTAGQVVFTVDVSGSMSVDPLDPFFTLAGLDIRYRQGAGPAQVLLRADLDDGGPFIVSKDGSAFTPGESFGGFALGADTIAGGGSFDTLALDFTFGTPFDFSLGLLTFAYPGPGGTAEADFLGAAVLGGIAVVQGGQEVTGFTVTSGSGTPYDATGVDLAPVPLPGGLGLLAAALAGLAASAGRRGRGLSAPAAVP